MVGDDGDDDGGDHGYGNGDVDEGGEGGGSVDGDEGCARTAVYDGEAVGVWERGTGSEAPVRVE